MVRTVSVGTCCLCLERDTVLRDSHLMPRGFYKIARRAGERNPNPIVVGDGKAVKTSKQVSDYLLCDSCEDRFNKRGEKWVQENCWHSQTQFPLWSALRGASAVYAPNQDFAIYEGAAIPAVDVDRLAYFAASVFWRACVHQWDRLTKLDLGPYTEHLRQFLMDKQYFPKKAVLIVTVSRSTAEERNQFMVFPFLKNHTGRFRQYKFTVPGLTFQLFVGKKIPNDVRALCSVRSKARYIFMAKVMDDMNLSDMGSLISTTRTVGDLR